MTITDWRSHIRARASERGVALPDAAVEEMAEHLDEMYSAARREGSSDAEALATARAALEESTTEALRSLSKRRPVRETTAHLAVPTAGEHLNIAGALRLAVRQLRLRPGFAALTILVLALGVGASTTVFTVVDSVLLRPLPYAEPDRLVTLWDTNSARGLRHEPISPVNFMDYRALPEFEGAAAWWRPSINLVDPGLDPVRVNTIEVSGNLFDVLGIRPQIGQGFPVGGPFFLSSEPLVVISDRLWRTRYNADPSIVGRQLRFNGEPHMVAGVMPPRFHFPDEIDVWQRLRWDLTRHSRGAHFMESVLRLSRGATFDQAVAAADTLGRGIAKEFPQTNARWAPRLVPLLDEQLGYYRPALMVLVGATGLVLLIGCLNVASLLLTRALSREREVAVRLAIGASPRHLMTQLFAEGLVLASAGAIVGVLAAVVALPALIALTPLDVPRLDQAHVDLRALGLAVAIVATTTIVFGLVPSFALIRRGAVDLRSGERGSSRGARRAYTALVAGQVALACTLLVSSALLVRTVMRMMDTPTGVDADDVVTTSVQLTTSSASQGVTDAQWREMADRHASIIDLVRRQPGVVSAGATSALPLDIGWRLPYEIDGDSPRRSDERLIGQFQTVTDGYFESMKAPLVAGRFFSTLDTYNRAPVVIVNETFAARHREAGRSMVGRQLLTNVGFIGPLSRNLMVSIPQPPRQPFPSVPFEIIGVVKDVRNVPLGQSVEPAVYFSAGQFPFRQLFLAVRASDTGTAVRAVRSALVTIAANVPIDKAETWAQKMATRTAEPRLLMTLLIFFGTTAGLLAALGVYGLFSWSVALRTRELAIRLTLGAKPVSVGVRVIRQSLTLIVVGLVAGLAIIRIAEGTLARVLFDLSPRDPASVLAACALLVASALAACVPAALRALRVDPVVGLRAE